MDEVKETRGGLTAKQREAAYVMVRGQMPLEDVMKKGAETAARDAARTMSKVRRKLGFIELRR